MNQNSDYQSSTNQNSGDNANIEYNTLSFSKNKIIQNDQKPKETVSLKNRFKLLITGRIFKRRTGKTKIQRITADNQSISSKDQEVVMASSPSPREKSGNGSWFRLSQNGSLNPSVINSALRRAAQENNYKAVEAALVLDGDPNDTNHAGWSALHFAAAFADIYIVRILIHHDATLDKCTPQGWTPLMLAAYYNQSHIVKYLLKKGADVNVENNFGSTPLLRAAWNNATESIMVMFKYAHPEPNHTDHRGRTALHWAAGNGNFEIMSILIHFGANIHSRDDDNALPSEYATKYNRKHVHDFLYHVDAHSHLKSTSSPSRALTCPPPPPEVAPTFNRPYYKTAKSSHLSHGSTNTFSSPANPNHSSPSSTTSHLENQIQALSTLLSQCLARQSGTVSPADTVRLLERHL